MNVMPPQQVVSDAGSYAVRTESWPRCIFCNVRDASTVFSGKYADVLACRRCGHSYSSFAGDPDYAGYFGQEIPQGAYDPNRAFWELSRQRVHHEFLDMIGPKGKSLVDVGCGLGYFVKRACARGAEAYGCELSPAAVGFAREQLGLMTVVQGDVEVLDLPPSSVDVITLWDVIEHLTDPLPLLSRLRRLLRPDGLLFIQTPNVRFQLVHARMKQLLGIARGDLMETRDHLNNFSRRTLAQVLDRAGFGAVRYRVLRPTDSVGLRRSVPLVLAKRSYVAAARFLFRVSGEQVMVSNTLHAFAQL